MAAKVWRGRLRGQPTTGQPHWDRWVTYFIGEPDHRQKKRVRGTWFVVESAVKATRHLAELDRLAWQASDAGEIAQFLLSLDNPAAPKLDATPTFQDFSGTWLATLETDGHPESEMESTRSIVKKHLWPFFGKHRLSEITSRMVDEYKAAKRRQKHQYGTGYSASAINSHLSVLNRLFQKAMEYGHATASPVLRNAWLRRERTPEDSTNWWRFDEEVKVFEHLCTDWRISKPRRYFPIKTQYLAALRVGELRVLRPMDLEFDGPTPGIWIRRSMARKTVSTPKNGHARFVPIPHAFAKELRVWSSLRDSEALLFPGEHGGPLRNNVINRWYADLCREAGVRRISSHGARHTAGSTLAAMGAGQKVIGAALGHRDSKATERYTHVQASVVAPLAEARWQKLTDAAGAQQMFGEEDLRLVDAMAFDEGDIHCLDAEEEALTAG